MRRTRQQHQAERDHRTAGDERLLVVSQQTNSITFGDVSVSGQGYQRRHELESIAEPSNIFNRAMLRAIRKWKYKPKIVDGVAVARAGVRVRQNFELDQ